jgi:hypothetical protein
VFKFHDISWILYHGTIVSFSTYLRIVNTQFILLCPNHHKEFDIGKRKIILHNEEIIKFKIEDDEYSISFEINV